MGLVEPTELEVIKVSPTRELGSVKKWAGFEHTFWPDLIFRAKIMGYRQPRLGKIG